MSNAVDTARITHYLHEHIWEFHVPGGGYDIERMAQVAQARFEMAPDQLAALRDLAGQVAGDHCPQCGAGIQAGGQGCFCCGWAPR
jgi:hypothetical protein